MTLIYALITNNHNSTKNEETVAKSETNGLTKNECRIFFIGCITLWNCPQE